MTNPTQPNKKNNAPQMEELRNIECSCGKWEQFPADMPRHSATCFVHVENHDDGEASYRCSCGEIVKSQCEVDGEGE
jgi:hypothetical protein